MWTSKGKSSVKQSEGLLFEVTECCLVLKEPEIMMQHTWDNGQQSMLLYGAYTVMRWRQRTSQRRIQSKVFSSRFL